jgi:hypothetical protein
MTIPAIAPPDMEDVVVDWFAAAPAPVVCMTPAVMLDRLALEEELTPLARQDTSFPSSTTKTLLRAVVRKGSFKVPDI